MPELETHECNAVSRIERVYSFCVAAVLACLLAMQRSWFVVSLRQLLCSVLRLCSPAS